LVGTVKGLGALALTALAGFLLLTVQPHAIASPLLGSARDAAGLRVYADSDSPTRFYYAPDSLQIASDENSSPQVSFLQMRYMGTSSTSDKGDFRTMSILSFGVELKSADSKRLDAAKRALRNEGKTVYRLSPLPIRKIEATLNYTPLADSQTQAPSGEAKPVGNGELRESDEKKMSYGYWTERVFTIAPDDATSQALWEAFQKGWVMLSLSYSFHADGIAPENEKPKVEGNVELPLEEAADDAEPEEQQPDPRVILADVVAVRVDAKQHPDRFQQIDINENVPANYAALSVYCYDFNNSLRPDLYEKTIEIEATSVTGKPIVREITFSKAAPDIYSASVRFPFAVSLKHAYRYRIREITNGGESTTKRWQDGKPWTQILDVTTPPEEQPKADDNDELSGGEE
jgi:hypothetical protein